MVKGVMPFLITELIMLFAFIFFPALVEVPMGWLT